MDRLSTNLLQTIRKLDLLLPGDKVVVGVSGGADSVALTHLLSGLREQLDIRLYIATINHGLRDSSLADIELVRRLGNNLGIPVYENHIRVKQIAKDRGIGIELTGRQARHYFFRKVAVEVGAEKVATGHHLDDQAETVLMHLLRGSGLQGAAGMKYVSNLPGAMYIDLIRPLLNVSRSQLRAYCADNELEFHDDASNKSLDWLRNRLRNRVMPLLKELVHPEINRALARFAEISAVDESLLRDIVAEKTEGFWIVADEAVYVDRSAFADWHPSIQRRFIFQLLKSYFPEADVSHNHIVNAVRIGMAGDVGSIAEFSGGCHLRVDYDNLIIERIGHQVLHIDDQYLLPYPGNFEILPSGITRFSAEGWGICCKMDSDGQGAAILVSKQSSTLVLRSRKLGDKFFPLGMDGHSKKVKSWMIDKKIPRGIRDRVPILADDDQILAILWNKRWYLSNFVASDINDSSKTWLFVCYE